MRHNARDPVGIGARDQSVQPMLSVHPKNSRALFRTRASDALLIALPLLFDRVRDVGGQLCRNSQPLRAFPIQE